MFAFRETCELDPATTDGGSRVEVAFTDASLDLQGGKDGFAAALETLVAATGVAFARLSQVHGDDVVEVVDAPPVGPSDAIVAADALVTTRRATGLMIRVADCVPVVLADPSAGVIGAAHAGRVGVQLDIVTRTVERMRAAGARDVRAWIGPSICGACYEVPAALREEVATGLAVTHAETSWGTPSLDLAAGVAHQLAVAGVPATRVPGCTREDPQLHSYRRDGTGSGRLAGLVWLP